MNKVIVFNNAPRWISLSEHLDFAPGRNEVEQAHLDMLSKIPVAAYYFDNKILVIQKQTEVKPVTPKAKKGSK